MKIWVREEEWFPVMVIQDSKLTQRTVQIEVTEEELLRFKAAATEFDACQEILNERHAALFKKEPASR